MEEYTLQTEKGNHQFHAKDISHALVQADAILTKQNTTGKLIKP